MSFAGDVNGPNMTRTQARRAIGNVARSHTAAPRAMQRGSNALQTSAAVECNECGTNTQLGRIVERHSGGRLTAAWLCNRCASQDSDDE